MTSAHDDVVSETTYTHGLAEKRLMDTIRRATDAENRDYNGNDQCIDGSIASG